MSCDGDETFEVYSLELWRRAIACGDQDAWAGFQQCLEETVLTWLHEHPSREAACRGLSEKHLVAQAFEGFRQAASAVRVDLDGNAYVPGQTSSTDFPTTADALQSTYGAGASDAFVVKLNRTGSRLLYSTYLGGSGDDGSNGSGVGINQGCNGSVCNVYVNGFTNSVNFPTTAGRSSTLWREASMSSVSS